MSALVIVALVALAVPGPTVAFVPIGSESSTHTSITETALLQKVIASCRAVVEAGGHEFQPTVGNEIRMEFSGNMKAVVCKYLC